MKTRAKSRSRLNTAIGSLRNDLEITARRVLKYCAASAVTVWVDDDALVYVTPTDAAVGIDNHWIVGNYLLGVTATDIEDDLRAQRRERVRGWILD